MKLEQHEITTHIWNNDTTTTNNNEISHTAHQQLAGDEERRHVGLCRIQHEVSEMTNLVSLQWRGRGDGRVVGHACCMRPPLNSWMCGQQWIRLCVISCGAWWCWRPMDLEGVDQMLSCVWVGSRLLHIQLVVWWVQYGQVLYGHVWGLVLTAESVRWVGTWIEGLFLKLMHQL